MDKDFPCKTCGHRNVMHTSLEDAAKYRNHQGRMCIEYKYYPDFKAKYKHTSEEICKCNDFVPDNLKYLEIKSGSSIPL